MDTGLKSNRMKILIHTFLAALLFACLGAGCTSRDADTASREMTAGTVFPEHGAYVGAYIDFGQTEDNVTLDMIEEFEKLAGKRITVVASSSFWGEQSFPTKNLTIIARHLALPLVFWSPWDRPYKEEVGPDRFGLNEILAGTWNAYIDAWAEAARDHGGPILVSWGLEMNGCWFPWSGCYYSGTANGADRPMPGPDLYKAAFRHVVDRVRAKGASNVLWGFHANNFSYPYEPWNILPGYYPGPEYVDWLGISVYGKQAADDDWFSFHQVMDNAYGELCKLDPMKPVVIAEWGVGEFPQSGDKAVWFREAFTAIETEYTRVKAAVYWHERWRNSDESYSNLHVHSSPESLEAFRQGLASPFWKDHLGPVPPKPVGKAPADKQAGSGKS
jgi:hypothetical protein